LILDSSAVVSVLRGEEGYRRLVVAMESAGAIAIGAPTLFETGMVAIGRFGPAGLPLLDRFLVDWQVEVKNFGSDHWLTAVGAFARFGKGRHPARLNLGDCMTYATARLAEMPLLFTGEDFAMTDLEAA
jgi:ribonuclease VapC